MALQKLRDSIATTGAPKSMPNDPNTGEMQSGTSPTPRLSLVRADEIDLEAALQELAEIIETEEGILIP